MRPTKLILFGLVCACSVLGTRQASAQLAVVEVNSLPTLLESISTTVNTASTATSTAATAANTFDTLQQALTIASNTSNDIASLGSVVIEAKHAENLRRIWAQTERLLFSMQHVASQASRLFGTENPPLMSHLYYARRMELLGYRNQAYNNARQVQQLIASAWDLVEQAIQLLSSYAVIIGNKQATLTLTQVALNLQQVKMEDNTTRTAFEHANTLDAQDRINAEREESQIVRHLMSNHPR